jgi:ribosomal protein L37E
MTIPDSSKSSQGLGDEQAIEAAAKAICDEIDDSAFEALENGKAEYRRAARKAVDAYRASGGEPIPEREALAELLRLKEEKPQRQASGGLAAGANRNYQLEKDAAWDRARQVLAALPSPPEQTEGDWDRFNLQEWGEFVRCRDRGTHSERTESGQCAECGYSRSDFPDPEPQLSTPAEPTEDLMSRLKTSLLACRRCGHVVGWHDGEGRGCSRRHCICPSFVSATAEEAPTRHEIARAKEGIAKATAGALTGGECEFYARAALSTPPSTPQEKP